MLGHNKIGDTFSFIRFVLVKNEVTYRYAGMPTLENFEAFKIGIERTKVEFNFDIYIYIFSYIYEHAISISMIHVNE